MASLVHAARACRKKDAVGCEWSSGGAGMLIALSFAAEAGRGYMDDVTCAGGKERHSQHPRSDSLARHHLCGFIEVDMVTEDKRPWRFWGETRTHTHATVLV